MSKTFNVPAEYNPNLHNEIKDNEQRLDNDLGLSSLGSCSDISEHNNAEMKTLTDELSLMKMRLKLSEDETAKANERATELKEEHDKLFNTHKIVVKKLQHVIERQRIEINEGDEILDSLHARIESLEKDDNSRQKAGDGDNNNNSNEVRIDIKSLDNNLSKSQPVNKSNGGGVSGWVETTIKKMQTELRECRNSCREWEHKYANECLAHQALISEIEAKASIIEPEEKRIQDLENKLKDMNVEYVNVTKECELLRKEKETTVVVDTKEVDDLKAKIQGLQQDTSAKHDKLVAEHNDLKLENASLSASLKRSEQIHKMLEDRITEYDVKVKELEQSLQQKDVDYEGLKVKVKDKMVSASAQYNKVKDEYTKAKQLCKTQADTIAELRTRTTTTTEQLTELHKKANNVKVANDALRDEVTSVFNNMNEIMSDFVKKIVAKVDKDARGLKNDLHTQMLERRRLFNLVQELRGNIRVFCRVRPVLNIDKDAKLCTTYKNPGTITMIDNQGKSIPYTFEFEQVFEPKHSQEHVFSHVKDLITCVRDGYNVCIFAYGQTGSGKTYTMQGTTSNRGINYRAIELLFNDCQKEEDVTYTIKAQQVEIYCEQIHDLLSDDNHGNTSSRSPTSKSPTKLKVIKGPNGMVVHGAVIETVETAADVFELMKKGQKNRSTGCTDMNARSSRSHLVFSIFISSYNKITGEELHGKLHLIDLAGSERIARSHATGQQLEEAKKINGSLLALGNCISARANKRSHVPYRDSALTFLLQDSLEKNSKTLMLVQVAPTEVDYGESLCSLRFAEHVRKVELGKATRNKSSNGRRVSSGKQTAA